MITRHQILSFLDCFIHVVSDVRDILSVVPDYETLLRHVSMFRDFLKKHYEDNV